MRRALSRLAIAVALAAVLGTAAAVPAGASTYDRLVPPSDRSAPATPNALGDSLLFAGYVGYLPRSTSSFDFTAGLVVPRVTCNSSVVSPMFIDVLVDGTLAGGGSTTSGVEIEAQCSGSTPRYTAAALVDGVKHGAVPVDRGDRLRIVGGVSATDESYAVTDDTQSRTFIFDGQGLGGFMNLQYTTQFGIGTHGGFPVFTHYRYYHLTVNYQPFALIPDDGLSQIDNAGTVMVQASPLSSSGKSFVLTYETNTGD